MVSLVVVLVAARDVSSDFIEGPPARINMEVDDDGDDCGDDCGSMVVVEGAIGLVPSPDRALDNANRQSSVQDHEKRI